MSNQPTTPPANHPVAVVALDVAPRIVPSNYPEPFASRMAGRVKRALGDVFGLRNFGVNLTTLAPGAASSIRHAHSLQDELVYVLQGRVTLHSDAGATELLPGMCAGFVAGSGNAHCIVNTGDEPALLLEIGDRTPGDQGSYPDDDLLALRVNNAWRFTHKDGRPYD